MKTPIDPDDLDLEEDLEDDLEEEFDENFEEEVEEPTPVSELHSAAGISEDDWASFIVNITDNDEDSPPEAIEEDSPLADLSLYIEDVSIIDTIGIYMKEMSSVPLLTLEEEVELAKRILKGRECIGLLAGVKPGVDTQNADELRFYIEDGFNAREHLIKANTRLVVSIAKKYMGQSVPFLDLIQEGNLGLMKAVEKYDHTRGFRFSTYATWWIRQTITRAIAEQGRTIRIPVHMVDRIRLMYKTAQDLEQIHERPPTSEELAEAMEIDHDKVQWMIRVSWLPISLESPVGDEEDSEFGQFVEDESSPTPPQVATQNLLSSKVDEILATLTPREARIIRLRFGLEDGTPHTLEEVGEKFGLTRERIRQIESKALRRLRHPRRARHLKDYL